jgi:hypothetical protein
VDTALVGRDKGEGRKWSTKALSEIWIVTSRRQVVAEGRAQRETDGITDQIRLVGRIVTFYSFDAVFKAVFLF